MGVFLVFEIENKSFLVVGFCVWDVNEIIWMCEWFFGEKVKVICININLLCIFC